MAGKKFSLTAVLCLTFAVMAGLLVYGRDHKQQPFEEPAPLKAAAPAPAKAEYANDLDRLGQLTDRINTACRKSHVVLLGAAGPTGGGGPVSVDYALFDRLSDDGAAVLIAEAVTAKDQSPSQIQGHANAARAVLQSDEAAGRYVARAGFSSAGFCEWLEAGKAFVTDPRGDSLPQGARIAAFMWGYSSEQYVKGK
jgi:hypothetical protein